MATRLRDRDWDVILDNIEAGRCVVQLGPDLCTPDEHGEKRNLAAELSYELAEMLAEDRNINIDDPHNLRLVRRKGFFPLVVRATNADNWAPLDCLYQGICQAGRRGVEQRQIDEYEPEETDWNKTSLWHFFKTLEIWRNDKLLTPVLIVDQFEELFTLQSAGRRKRFIDELADLVRGTRPKESNDKVPGLSERPPDVKVVLSLREDFLANLEELAERIPAILKSRFRLNPLSREQARRAIVEPAALQDQALGTPPFRWADDAQNGVLDFLCERQIGDGKTEIADEVEPFQLQLICQHVEDIVTERDLQAFTAKDLGGNGRDSRREIHDGVP